jgi:SAM-dependent methyltransferase
VNNFFDYAKYYDLLYQDKNYTAEIDYIEQIIFNESAQEPKSILEMGCGTGVHAELLAERGHTLHAIDLSSNMLELAKQRIGDGDLAERLKFDIGDVRDYKVGKKFEIVLSLFHVASYQVTDDDFEKFIVTAEEHLSPGGILLFDFWHKPAVLAQKPQMRVKRCDSELGHLVRIAEPEMDVKNEVVDVNYQVFISDGNKSGYRTFSEQHKMRYFSCDFVRDTLEARGFKHIRFEQWLTGAKASEETWGVCAVAKL